MTSEEFRHLLQQQTDVQLLDPCLHDDGTPFVFEPQPTGWDKFRDELVVRLGVSRSAIRVVGSARFGFSMKPGYSLKGFVDTSDIDVVVVNPSLFDQLWEALLEAAYPRPPITQQFGGWLEKRRRELYTGWLTPLEIRLDSKIFGVKARPVLDFNTRWFNALKEASRYPSRRHEDITGRLYRTWRHAELYHLDSLAVLRKTLSE
ncbi:MAG: hypothetical protein A3F90_10260 [Deltaproteobacteria bacterium RIFCSPLOWO2_12_FULL_60_19]|nr:MAG: hypothetical protein A3F90_10260 [Deltaproteobacteria bacterium RIFCSPLOWO2_12_FULL_60_19]